LDNLESKTPVWELISCKISSAIFFLRKMKKILRQFFILLLDVHNIKKSFLFKYPITKFTENDCFTETIPDNYKLKIDEIELV
jgi:hypothetical protein